MKLTIKFFFLSVILCFFLLLFKREANKEKFIKANEELKNAINSKEHSAYFIGSSRVMFSVNENFLTSQLSGVKLFNCGSIGASFFSNAAFSMELLKSGGRKTIFIELSPALPSVSADTYLLADVTNLNMLSSIFSLFKADDFIQNRKFYVHVFNDYLIKKLSMENDLKVKFNLINPKLHGFVAMEGNGYTKTNSFLTFEELNEPQQSNTNELLQYMNYINYLVQLGNKHNSKVVFFMPLVYMYPKEKKLILSVYKNIPDSLKVSYSKDFLNEISKAEYLLDINHFNKAGSDKFCKLLLPVIDSICNTEVKKSL